VTLRDALQTVYARHGKLTPQIVVDEARAAQDEAGQLLRGRLEWDDAVAGEAHRRQQAHEMIRSVRVVYREATDKKPEQSIRAFHAVRGNEGHVYEPLDKVSADPFLSRLVMADMEREWRQLKSRWEHFREFMEMVRRDVDAEAA